MQDPSELTTNLNLEVSAVVPESKDAPDIKATLKALYKRIDGWVSCTEFEHAIIKPHLDKLLSLVDVLEKTNATDMIGPDLYQQLNQAISDIYADLRSKECPEELKTWLTWLLTVNQELKAGIEKQMKHYFLVLAGEIASFNRIFITNMWVKSPMDGSETLGPKLSNPELHRWLALENTAPWLPKDFAQNLAFAQSALIPSNAPTNSKAGPLEPQPSHNFFLKLLARAQERPIATALIVIGVAGLLIGSMALGGTPVAAVIGGLLAAKIVTGISAGFFAAGGLALLAPKKAVDTKPAFPTFTPDDSSLLV